MARKRIFVSGPITKGDRINNLAQALQATRTLWNKGYAPFCPHLTMMTEHLFQEHLKYEDYIEQCLAWVEVSDAVLRLPGESAGADRECAHAASKNIPVFTVLGRLLEIFPV